MAAISAEIAAVITQAQAQSRLYQEGIDDDGEGEDDLESGEGGVAGTTCERDMQRARLRAGVLPPALANSGTADDDDDGDDFPVPLRQRRQNNTTVAISNGLKRKR